MSLARIAAALDLSVTTVSRALAGYDDVAAATRARVQAEAERIGYRANRTARRLRTGANDAVGIVLPTGPGQLEDAFFLRLIGTIGPLLAEAGLDLVVAAARPGEQEMALYRQLVENRRVDGIFVARTRRRDPRIRYLLDSGMPFVVHGRTQERRAYAHVDVDGAAAFRAATERLLRFGHRRIALVNAPAAYSFAHHREAGWRAALKDAGVAPGPTLEGEASEENGFRLAQSLLRAPAPPTAILCATDRLAVGALHAIASSGLRAGRDVSVIGYDNLPVATYTDPPLTSFEPAVEETAAAMVGMMLALLGGAPPAGMSVLRQATLIARASDGPSPRPATRATTRKRQEGERIHDR